MSKKVRRYLIKYNNRKEEATGREVDLLRQSGIKVKVLKKLTDNGLEIWKLPEIGTENGQERP